MPSGCGSRAMWSKTMVPGSRLITSSSSMICSARRCSCTCHPNRFTRTVSGSILPALVIAARGSCRVKGTPRTPPSPIARSSGSATVGCTTAPPRVRSIPRRAIASSVTAGFGEDLAVVLAEARGRLANRARRALQSRNHMVHRIRAHVDVGIVGYDLALDEVRILEDLRDVVDRPDGDFRLLEEGDGL